MLIGGLSVRNIQLIYMDYNRFIIIIILDLVVDTSNSNAVSFLPSPFSGPFVFFPNLMHYFMQNLTVNNLAFNPHYITHK